MTSNRPEYGSSLLLNKNEMPLFVEAALEMPRVRDQALCLLIFFTGCRPSEANQIKPDSLIPDRFMVEFPTLKQRQKVNPTRRVHVPEFLMTRLLKGLRNRQGLHESSWVDWEKSEFKRLTAILRDREHFEQDAAARHPKTRRTCPH